MPAPEQGRGVEQPGQVAPVNDLVHWSLGQEDYKRPIFTKEFGAPNRKETRYASCRAVHPTWPGRAAVPLRAK